MELCKHPGPKQGTVQHSCYLLKGHDGTDHCDHGIMWNKDGQLIDTASPSMKAAQAAQQSAAAEAPRKQSKEKSASPKEPEALIQGKPATVKLKKIVAFDRENMRHVKLVEEARRLRAEKVSPDDQAYKELVNEIDDLMASVPVVGLLEPLVVYKLAGEEEGYKLKAGSRRMATLILLHGDEQEVNVMVREDDKEDLAHLAENLARRDVDWHLVADAFYKLRKKHSADVLASATGYSVSGVNNLIRVRTKLHPKIWTVIMKYAGTPQAQSMERMLKLCALSHDEQLKAWEEHLNPKKGGNDGEGGKAPKAAPVLDLDTLDGLQPETVPREMEPGEIQQLIAILKSANAKMVEQPRQFSDLLAMGRGALGALEAVMGLDTDEVNVLRQLLLRVRNAAENAPSKRAKGSAKVREQKCGKKFKKGGVQVECDKPKGHAGAHSSTSAEAKAKK